MRRKGHERTPHAFNPCMEMISRKLNTEEKRMTKLRLRLQTKKEQRKAKIQKEKQQKKLQKR